MTDSTKPKRLAWTCLKDLGEVQGLTVSIVASDEPPSLEYLVVIFGPPMGASEVARCDRFAPGALANITRWAEIVFDTLQLAECSWEPRKEDVGGAP